jgi:hypothetical protein
VHAYGVQYTDWVSVNVYKNYIHFTYKWKSKPMKRKVWNVDILSHVKQGKCTTKKQAHMCLYGFMHHKALTRNLVYLCKVNKVFANKKFSMIKFQCLY